MKDSDTSVVDAAVAAVMWPHKVSEEEYKTVTGQYIDIPRGSGVITITSAQTIVDEDYRYPIITHLVFDVEIDLTPRKL